MAENPEEGRISPEQQAMLLRDARRKTTLMKREYRNERKVFAAQAKKHDWIERHAEKHEEVTIEMGKVSRRNGPQNRRVRRAYAKMMNAYKIPGGWQQFNSMYSKQFGYQTSVARNKSNSIIDAMKAGE